MKWFSVLGLFAILLFLVSPLSALGADGYGVDSSLVGGGAGYVSPHGYSVESADYVVSDLDGLVSAIRKASSGQVIWVEAGSCIETSSPIGTLNSGVALASCRGSGTPGTIHWTSYSSGSMTPLIWVKSNCIVSGLVLEGPGGYSGTGTLIRTNQGIRGMPGAVGIEVENCEIYKFAEMGIYFYGGHAELGSEDQHWIHHCYIHNCQRHGFGYGIAEEGGCSYLAEYNYFDENRHHIMAQASLLGSTPNNYEVRYNYFGDAVYGYMGNPNNLYYNHQVDCHGGSPSSVYAGGTLLIHHNTFTANKFKLNVAIRGIPKYKCEVYNNWTMKSTKSGASTETSSNSYFSIAAPGGTSSSVDSLSEWNMAVYDNWYGSSPPKGNTGQAPTTTVTPVVVKPTDITGDIQTFDGGGEEEYPEESYVEQDPEAEDPELWTWEEVEENEPGIMRMISTTPYIFVGVGLMCLVGLVATSRVTGVNIMLAGIGAVIVSAGTLAIMRIIG